MGVGAAEGSLICRSAIVDLLAGTVLGVLVLEASDFLEKPTVVAKTADESRRACEIFRGERELEVGDGRVARGDDTAPQPIHSTRISRDPGVVERLPQLHHLHQELRIGSSCLGIDGVPKRAQERLGAKRVVTQGAIGLADVDRARQGGASHVGGRLHVAVRMHRALQLPIAKLDLVRLEVETEGKPEGLERIFHGRNASAPGSDPE